MISKKNFILSICFALIYICSQLPLKAADSDQNVLWAWQRNEDLSYLNPASYSVAYLACYATISGANLHLEWRNQALKIPAGTNLVPVLRIDINHRSKPELTEEKLGGLSDVILRISKISRTQRVQIDFDALENEREFYRNLLKKNSREIDSRDINIDNFSGLLVPL